MPPAITMSDDGVAQPAPAAATAQQAPDVDNVDTKQADAPATAADADTKADDSNPAEEKAGATPAESTKDEQASKPSEGKSFFALLTWTCAPVPLYPASHTSHLTY